MISSTEEDADFDKFAAFEKKYASDDEAELHGASRLRADLQRVSQQPVVADGTSDKQVTQPKTTESDFDLLEPQMKDEDFRAIRRQQEMLLKHFKQQEKG